MRLAVTKVDAKAESVRELHFARVDGAPLPPFAPGAHVVLTLEIDGRSLERHYSLVSDPDDDHAYAIAILRDERGVGSRFLHDRVAEGDHVEVSVPRNEFRLEAGEEPLIFIAGGIGITPILNMVRASCASGRDFVVHYAARSAARMAYAADVESLAAQRSTLYVDEGGRSRMNVGTIIADAPDNAHVYVCGPFSLVDAVRKETREKGWNNRRVHFESFGARVSPADRAVRVHLAQSDLDIDVVPGQSILDALLSAGAFIGYECRRGECGSCVATVVDGTPIHRDVCLDDEGRRGSMCTCVSWASSERLVLDL